MPNSTAAGGRKQPQLALASLGPPPFCELWRPATGNTIQYGTLQARWKRAATSQLLLTRVMPRIYQYIGPRNIAARLAGRPPGSAIRSSEDVHQWIQATGQLPDREGRVIATFVVDESGTLRIADRRSEHVACAGGMPVLSAGEMTFSVISESVAVEEASNQSTGYCPEPESWPSVAAALGQAGIQGPAGFTSELTFRRCVHCGALNVVKDHFFECGTCSAELPRAWNLGN
jgi:hypothetical protein